MANGQRHHAALPAGYKLHWYEVESILGQGGFGITYLAKDANLNQKVAIKEFLPTELAVRTQNSAVEPMSKDHVETYGWGLSSFVTEAQTLAKFHHPNIVSVRSVFEENNTAYMVMNYVEGQTLSKSFRTQSSLSEQQLKDILYPLLDGLEKIHAAGFIHRDIKPDNIYLQDDGTPILIDFGSARQAFGVATRTLTALVSPGYAPYEQYDSSRGGTRQGPWTDIYALGAVLYRAVTGRPPDDSTARVHAVLEGQDSLVSAREGAKSEYSADFLDAIDSALRFEPRQRPQNVAEWRAMFAGETAPEQEVKTQTVKTLAWKSPHVLSHGITSRAALLVGLAGVVAAGVAFALWWSSSQPAPVEPESVAETQSQQETELLGLEAGNEAQPVAVQAADEENLPPEQPTQTQASIVVDEEITSETAVTDVEVTDVEVRSIQAFLVQRQRRVVNTDLDAPSQEETKIDELLSAAELDVAALRLTSPAGNNAFEKYAEVLSRDPENENAKQGLENIVTRYLRLANKATDAGEFDQAATYLARADSVYPGATSVAAAKAALAQRREQAALQAAISARASSVAVDTQASEDAALLAWGGEWTGRHSNCFKGRRTDRFDTQFLSASVSGRRLILKQTSLGGRNMLIEGSITPAGVVGVSGRPDGQASSPHYVFEGNPIGANRIEGKWTSPGECDEGDWYLERTR